MPHHLIIAADGSDIIGYYLLDDAAMERAQKVSDEESNGDDFFVFVSNPRRRGMKEFKSITALWAYVQSNNITIDGEYGAIAY